MVLRYGPKYHMKYFYRNFEFLHSLVAVQFDKRAQNSQFCHISLATYARNFVFSLKAAEIAHLYLQEKKLQPNYWLQIY